MRRLGLGSDLLIQATLAVAGHAPLIIRLRTTQSAASALGS